MGSSRVYRSRNEGAADCRVFDRVLIQDSVSGKEPPHPHSISSTFDGTPVFENQHTLREPLRFLAIGSPRSGGVLFIPTSSVLHER